jgi:hypothetical protein
MEAGTHSIWISEQLQELGHEVIVANVRELRAISHSDRKSDRCREAGTSPGLTRRSCDRSRNERWSQQESLTLIRARDLLVRLRTAAVNAVCGLTKSSGQPSVSPEPRRYVSGHSQLLCCRQTAPYSPAPDSDHVLIEPRPPELAGVPGLSLSQRATVGKYLPVYPVATIDVRRPT